MSCVNEVFEQFKQANLTLNPSKCRLFQTRVEFLGFVVSQEGIHCDEKKIGCIKNWETLKNVHAVQSVVGFCQYHRYYVPQFTTICAPLHELMKKK